MTKIIGQGKGIVYRSLLPKTPVLSYIFSCNDSLSAASRIGPDISFVRSSDAWSWVEGPVLKKFAADEPRINTIDPATGEKLGYLAEESRTNELLDNRDLSTGNWNVNAAISLSQNMIGVDGQSNVAFTVEDTDGGSFNNIAENISVNDDSSTHTVRYFIGKDNDESRFPLLAIKLSGGTAIREQVSLNTKTGDTYERETNGFFSIKDVGDFWELILGLTNNNSGNTLFSYRLYPSFNDKLDTSGNNVAGSCVYDFGQVELNASFASSPIETGGSPVTRAADEMVSDLPSSAADGFVVFVDFKTSANVSDPSDIFAVHDNSTDNQFLLRVEASEFKVFNKSSDNNIFFPLSFGSASTEQDVKGAFRFDSGNYGFSVNGRSTVADSSTEFPNGLAQLEIGTRNIVPKEPNAPIASVEIYDNPSAWTDADLEEASKL